MFISWVIIIVLACACVYVFYILFLEKNRLKQQKIKNQILQNTLNDAEALVKKYQNQLHKSIENIEILSEQLTSIKTNSKSLIQSSNELKEENARLKKRIQEIEKSIEVLL